MKDDLKGIQVGDFIRCWLGHQGEVVKINTDRKLKPFEVAVDVVAKVVATYTVKEGLVDVLAMRQNLTQRKYSVTEYYHAHQVEKIACKWPKS